MAQELRDSPEEELYAWLKVCAKGNLPDEYYFVLCLLFTIPMTQVVDTSAYRCSRSPKQVYSFPLNFIRRGVDCKVVSACGRG